MDQLECIALNNLEVKVALVQDSLSRFEDSLSDMNN